MSAPQRYPDLTVSRVWTIPYTPEALFVLLAEVTTEGDGPSLATTLRYYRSTDAAITTSDTMLGTYTIRWLSPSKTGLGSETLTVPSMPGTYYYGACVDAVANESNTTNNCSSGRRSLYRGRCAGASVEVTPSEVMLAALRNTAALTARVPGPDCPHPASMPKREATVATLRLADRQAKDVTSLVHDHSAAPETPDADATTVALPFATAVTTPTTHPRFRAAPADAGVGGGSPHRRFERAWRCVQGVFLNKLNWV